MSLEWALGNLLPATVEAFKLNDTYIPRYLPFMNQTNCIIRSFSLTETETRDSSKPVYTGRQAGLDQQIFSHSPRSRFALSTLVIGSSVVPWIEKWSDDC